MPTLASRIPSAILSTIVVMGLYFTTLGWASSCLLSGGTVVANDIYRYFVPDASPEKLVRVSRIAIAILSVLTVGFAILLPSGVEFWTIVGFVLRNTALFPLILTGLFWNAISKKAAICAAIAGSCTGIVWYLIKFPFFLFDAHPMFVGMAVSEVVIVLGTVIEYRGQMRFTPAPIGIFFGLLGCGGLVITILFAREILRMKLIAACISFTVSFFFLAVIFILRRTKGEGSPPELPPGKNHDGPDAKSPIPQRLPCGGV
jgi:hypothetical protein